MVVTQITSYLTGQLTPEIIEEINAPAAGQLALSVITLMLIFILMAWFINWLIGMLFPKSTQYRKLMADMYIVGMVKKFAKEDQIDLIEELKSFAKIERKSRLRYDDIDSVIADNLKEKIEAKSNKEIEKIEGK